MKNYMLLILCAVAMAGCVTDRATLAQTAKSQMTGLSKEAVLSCMGVPEGKAAEGSTEVWTYASGGGTDSFGSRFSQAVASAQTIGNTTTAAAHGYGLGSAISRNRYCTVNVVFTGGHVSAVNYSGRTGGLISKGEQCAYAVENCVSQ